MDQSTGIVLTLVFRVELPATLLRARAPPGVLTELGLTVRGVGRQTRLPSRQVLKGRTVVWEVWAVWST